MTVYDAGLFKEVIDIQVEAGVYLILSGYATDFGYYDDDPLNPFPVGSHTYLNTNARITIEDIENTIIRPQVLLDRRIADAQLAKWPAGATMTVGHPITPSMKKLVIWSFERQQLGTPPASTASLFVTGINLSKLKGGNSTTRQLQEVVVHLKCDVSDMAPTFLDQPSNMQIEAYVYKKVTDAVATGSEIGQLRLPGATRLSTGSITVTAPYTISGDHYYASGSRFVPEPSLLPLSGATVTVNLKTNRVTLANETPA